MVPEHLRFGGGAGESTILPLMALFLIVGVVLTVILPRNKAIVPFLLAFFIIPFGQIVLLAGVHFNALRILTLAALARRAVSRDKYPGGYNGIDHPIIIWSLLGMVAFCIQFPETQAFINALGTLVDTLGAYLVVRFLIPDRATMRRMVKTLAIICVIQAGPMIVEQITHTNVFGYVTGVSLVSAIREGKVRSAGTMGALTAGPFAGMLVPMFLWLWTNRKSRMAAIAGLAAAVIMVITSNSSTSTMALAGSIVGIAFWRFRTRMRQIRWALLCTLVGLHLYMKAPVWALIARVDLTGSSSSYQRYALVDMTIRNFREWWLMGTTDYVNWGWDSFDLCNQFVAVALTGGLLTLIVYIVIFKRGFAAVGTSRKLVAGDRKEEWFLWCLGSTLFATVVAYFGINSGALLMVFFFTLMTAISVAAFEAKAVTVQSGEGSGDAELVPAFIAADSDQWRPNPGKETLGGLFTTAKPSI